MSSILRILQDPALLEEEEQQNNAHSPLRRGGDNSKTGATRNVFPATTNKDGGESKTKDVNRRSSTLSQDNTNSNNVSTTPGRLSRKGSTVDGGEEGVKKKPQQERRQMIIIDEDEPNVAKLPQQALNLKASSGAAASLTASSPSKSSSPYATASERLQSVVALASGASGQGASVKFDTILDSAKGTAALVSLLKQQMSPQIVQRNNVVALFTGYGKEEFGLSAEFDASITTVFESLRGAVISATEAHQEMLSVMADGDTSLRGKVARLAQMRVNNGEAPLGGNSPNLGAMDDQQYSRGNSPSDIPMLAADGGDAMRSDFTPSRAGGAGRRVSYTPQTNSNAAPTSPDRRLTQSALSGTSGSPSSKYSLLMARLPRNAAELEVTQLMNIGRPLLPRLIDNGASRRASMGAGGSGEDGSTPTKSYLRYMRSRSPIGVVEGAVTSTTQFNGVKAGLMKAARTSPGYITLPFPLELNDALKENYGFSIHIWIRSDGADVDTARSMTVFHVADPNEPHFMLRLMANTNDAMLFERGQMLLTLRDMQGKYIESVFTVETCDGDWHSVSAFVNAKNKSLALAVDGKPCRSRIINTDDISGFEEPRVRTAYIGASPSDDRKSVSNTFSGFVLDYQTVIRGNKLLQHYPLAKNETTYERDLTKGAELSKLAQSYKVQREADAAAAAAEEAASGNKKSAAEKAKEREKRISMQANQDARAEQERQELLAQTAATFTDVECEEVMFCRTCPYFDGRGSYISVGTLGDWGLICNGCSIEFKVKVTNPGEPMCVIGVTDITGKQGGFGVELNTGIHGTIQRHYMSVWFTDRSGKTVRGSCDLTSDTYDDRWHTISIRLNDIATGKFKIRLDNRPLDTQSIVSAEAPHNFTTYSTHVTIGCMNNRGRHERYFKGCIRSLRLSHLKNEEDDPFANWPLDEGLHALVAFDVTSHGYGGSYHHIKGEKPFEWLPVGDDNETSDNDYIDMSKLNVTRHNHNQVSMAIVVVNTMINPKTGRTYEVLEDILNGNTLRDLEPIPVRDFNHRVKKSDNRVFKTIPDDCFRNTDSAEYLALFKQGLARAREFPRGHVIVVLRLGDAMFTAIDFASFTKSEKARLIVTPNHMNWADVTNTDGTTNKINLAINAQLANAEKLFFQVGTRPQLFKRTKFLRDLETSASGPDMLSCILTFSILSSVEACKLFLVEFLPPYTTHDEALHALLRTQGMQTADQHHAALMLTRAWRGRLGRNVHQMKLKLRDEANMRKNRAELLRKQFPKETLEKKVKHALIIKSAVFHYKHEMPQPLVDTTSDEVEKVSQMLQAMDFAVETVLDPSIESIWKALQHAKTEREKADAMLLVYFIGYGAHDVYTQPPTIAQQCSWTEEKEALDRVDLLHEHHSDWLALWKDFWTGLATQHKKEMQAFEELSEKLAKKKKKKKAAAPARPGAKGAAAEEVLFKPPPMPKRDSTDAMKRQLFSWMQELSPKVTRVSPDFSHCGGDGVSASHNYDDARYLSASFVAPFGNTVSLANLTSDGSLSFSSPKHLARNAGSAGGFNRTNNNTTVFTPDANTPLIPSSPHQGENPLSPTTARGHQEEASFRSDTSKQSNNNRNAARSPLQPNEEPTLEAQTYLLAADSTVPFNSSNTILLSEMKNFIVGHKPKRGHHSIFLYDCALIPTSTMPAQTGGFGGFAGASGEACHAIYKPDQQYLMGYYFKKCFVGAAVECVRVGRHPTEQHVTLETASQYINKKVGKDAPRPALSLSTRWFGEFIGDCFLAPTLLTTKEERRARKTNLATKKNLTRLTIKWDGALISEYRATLQTAIAAKMSSSKTSMCEIKRLTIEDHLILTYASDPVESNGCDYNALTRHAVAKEALKEDLERAFQDVPKLNYKVLFGHPVQIHVSLLPPAAEGGSSGADRDKDAKTVAFDFVQNLEKRNQLIDDYVVSNGLAKFSDGTRTIAGGRIASASVIIHVTVSVAEDDAAKLERLSRREQSAFCEYASLIGVHVYTDKENAAYENDERLFALDEVRKQNETKMRLTREAEARRKAEETRVKLLEQKDAMLERLRQCRSAGKIAQDDFDAFFSVPLLDAFTQVLEALNAMVNKVFAPQFAKFGLQRKLERMLCVDLIPPVPVRPPAPTGVNVVTDARLLLNVWKLLLAMHQLQCPIASPSIMQCLTASTFGGYQTTLNNTFVKVATQVLEVCGAAANDASQTRPFDMFVVDADEATNETIMAIEKRKREGSAFATAISGASPTRQRMSSVANASVLAAANAYDSASTRHRALFDILLKRWPVRVIPSELREELETAVVRLAPSVSDLIRLAGVKPMPPKKAPRENDGLDSGNASARSVNTARGNKNEKGQANDKAGGGFKGHSDEDDDEDLLFSPDIMFAEVARRCRESYTETAAIRKQYEAAVKQASAIEAANAAAVEGAAASAAADGGESPVQIPVPLFYSPTTNLFPAKASTCYHLTEEDMTRLLDTTNTTEQLPLSVITSLVFATAQFDPSTNESCQDTLDYLNNKVIWTKDAMEVLGPAFKANPQLDSLRKRLAANWSSDEKMQKYLLTDEERAPPPPPPPPVVEEPPKRGGSRKR